VTIVAEDYSLGSGPDVPAGTFFRGK